MSKDISMISDADLIEGTLGSRDHLVNVIHRYFFIFKKLTDKQRAVLFDHCEEEEQQEVVLDYLVEEIYRRTQ